MQQGEDVDSSKSESDEFYIKYEAKDILGKGLSSTVRRVVEKRTGREYAAKIIDLSTENNSDAQAADLRTAARREIALLLKLQGHPNIIELHEVFETSTFIFLVFEICKRGELFDYLTQYVRLSERRTRDFMRQLFDALNYIHERQCVHRDVKPENILLDDNFNIRLTDFGFATECVPIQIQEANPLSEMHVTDVATSGLSASIPRRRKRPNKLPAEELRLEDVERNERKEAKHLELNGTQSDTKESSPSTNGPSPSVRVELDEGLFELCGTPGYLAPEVLSVSMYESRTGYGRPADVWAAGVLMFTLLAGRPPFWNRKQMLMLRQIVNGEYTFGPEWEDISSSAKDLIQAILVTDPKKRITARDALNHPFLAREVHVRGFEPLRLFRSAVHAVIILRRIERILAAPRTVPVVTLRTTPYSLRPLRKMLDAQAFKLYGHWIKRGDNQNRAALFENVPKHDLVDFT